MTLIPVRIWRVVRYIGNCVGLFVGQLSVVEQQHLFGNTSSHLLCLRAPSPIVDKRAKFADGASGRLFLAERSTPEACLATWIIAVSIAWIKHFSSLS